MVENTGEVFFVKILVGVNDGFYLKTVLYGLQPNPRFFEQNFGWHAVGGFDIEHGSQVAGLQFGALARQPEAPPQPSRSKCAAALTFLPWTGVREAFEP